MLANRNSTSEEKARGKQRGIRKTRCTEAAKIYGRNLGAKTCTGCEDVHWGPEIVHAKSRFRVQDLAAPREGKNKNGQGCGSRGKTQKQAEEGTH